jgi:MFS family permease
MDKSTNKAYNPWVVWGVANVFYLYEVVLRVSPGVMTGDLMSHYGITSGMLGVLVSFFYYSYVVLQVPCGLILDKLGPRNLIGSSIILSTFGSVLFAATNQIYVGQLGRCMVGAGAACAFISSLQIASTVFPVSRFAIFAGITNMMGTIGALCAGFPIARAVNALGWKETICLLASIGVIITILAFWLIPKSIKIPETDSSGSALGRIVKNKQIVLSGLIGGFMYLPVSVFSELWAIPFFMEKYGINNEAASIVSSLLFVGFAIGSIPIAVIARKVNGYMKTIRTSIVGVALSFVPLIYVHNIYVSCGVVMLIGILTAAEVLVFTCAKNNESLKNAGTAVALANGLVMLAGSIFQPIVGALLDLFWTGKMAADGLRVYEISCYQKAILTLPICLVIAYVLSFFVKETIEMEGHQLEKQEINRDPKQRYA